MLKWLNKIIRGQEQGYTRTGAGIIAPNDFFPTQDVVTKDTCFGLPAFKRAIELIANKVAHCRCHIFRNLPNGGREFAKDHPAYRLVRRQANPYLSSVELCKSLIADAIWNGNSYAHIAPDYSGIYLLDPDQVRPVVVHKGTKQEVYYIFGQNTVLDASEVIHIKGLSTSCGLIGMRLLDYARENLALSQNTQRYASAFFKHGGLSDCWVEVPEGNYLDENAQREILSALNRMFSGVEKSHSPIVLTGGAKLNKTYLSNGDAQFLESRQFGIIDVANLCGIDPSFIGGQSNTSYGSLESINTASLSNSFNPWLSALENQLEAKLLRTDEQEEYYIEFDRSDLTRGDAQSDTANWVQKVNNGLASWEEYRKANNLPVDNKEKETFWRASNLVDAFAVVEPVAPIESQAIEQPAIDNVTRSQRDNLTKASLQRLIKRLAKDAPKSKDALAAHYPIFRANLPDCESFIDRLFDRLGDELESVLPEQKQEVYERLNVEKLFGEIWT